MYLQMMGLVTQTHGVDLSYNNRFSKRHRCEGEQIVLQVINGLGSWGPFIEHCEHQLCSKCQN